LSVQVLRTASSESSTAITAAIGAGGFVVLALVAIFAVVLIRYQRKVGSMLCVGCLVALCC
jgi:hypothetical protein